MSKLGTIYTRKDAKPCLGCGLPTNSRYGWCQRNGECNRAHMRLWWAANKTPRNDPPLFCLSCGKEFVLTKPRTTYTCVTNPVCKRMSEKIAYTLRKLEKSNA
jgi:hypothetical protein